MLELNADESAGHPNPYLSVEMHAEFRSPEHQTFLMPAFWDGGRRMVIRFSPVAAGVWDYRITSNVARFDGRTGRFNAAASDSKGFVRVANYRHFSYTEKGVKPIPHLWMGDTSYRFAVMDRALFERMVDTRAGQKFNHIRGLVIGNMPGLDAGYSGPEHPNPEYFRELDSRIRYMNERGFTADLVLAGDRNHLAEVFPSWKERRQYVKYIVSRYAPMNITWQGVQEFEEYEDGRQLLKEVGTLIKELDPYHHPQTTHTTATSAPLLADGWMDFILYQTSEVALAAIEHQMYAVPQVNAEFAYEDSGAGKSHDHHVDTGTFRKRLWNMTMSGVYPTFGNTGMYGGRKFEPDGKYLESPGAEQMTHWHDFFSKTRHWELEPFFEVDGGKALALTGIEYIVYLENPGQVELVTEKKTYQVYWFNPLTGEYIQRKKEKEHKGERFVGQPPDNSHDWVLHLSRDGRKKNMLERWYFESRRVPRQEIELNPTKIPYEIVEPSQTELPVDQTLPFSARLTRKSKATSDMMYVWTGEITAGGGGYRILGTGESGSLNIPRSLAGPLPGNISMRLLGINYYGKVYSLNRVYQITE